VATVGTAKRPSTMDKMTILLSNNRCFDMTFLLKSIFITGWMLEPLCRLSYFEINCCSTAMVDGETGLPFPFC
jgi:hypothetical protein